MCSGLHHIALIASSDATVAFYEKLGFCVTGTVRREKQNDTVVLMSDGTVFLELFIDPSHPKRTGEEPLGLRHLAFSVDDAERAAREWNGTPVRTDWVGKKFTVVRDPDGIAVELREK